LDSLKDFLRLAKKSLTDNLMEILTTIKYDGTKEVQQHILDMKNEVVKMNTSRMHVSDSFMIQPILNSLSLSV